MVLAAKPRCIYGLPFYDEVNTNMNDPSKAAAYGGDAWSPRTTSLRSELGRYWTHCGASSEWSPLKAVLLHKPGTELDSVTDPDIVQMLAPMDIQRARAQHDLLTQAFEASDVAVHYVQPEAAAFPNLMFVADLLFMTAEGAILGRPASTVRAGEERWIARRLGEIGIPILRTVRGTGTFEGADAMWIDPRTVLLATGLRTNVEGADMVRSTLLEMGVDVISVGLPYGAMHLMGTLRLLDRDLAVAWPGRVPYAAVEALRVRGYTVHFAPDETELKRGMALNVVTLGPRHVIMPAGNPATQAFIEATGTVCQCVPVDELVKAAGGIGCLTGILWRHSEL
jgi:N-dimethylarginine dimethylaminohydrolase